MARVPPARAGRQNVGPGFVKAGQTAKQRRKQKIVLENENQGPNADRSVVRSSRLNPHEDPAHPLVKLSFTANPPPGYTFIPMGNPQLTNALKDAARRGDYKVMSVSVRRYVRPHSSY
jgi:hypothetical protein